MLLCVIFEIKVRRLCFPPRIVLCATSVIDCRGLHHYYKVGTFILSSFLSLTNETNSILICASVCNYSS